MRARPAVPQRCPNCQTAHDVSVYVSGQRILCKSCGIHFEVRRTDVSTVGARPAAAEASTLRVAPAPSDGAPPEGSDTGHTYIATPPRVEIPGYELRDILGRGGMGEVWVARQISLGRTVAIKLLPPKLASDPEFVARFEKEATALASLSHPNIIQIIDRGVTAAGHCYFVMEYVEGRSLRELISEGRLEPTAAARLLVQVCRAIECAHEKHIIHRDLKPENILVDARSHVKVADFGLAGIQGPEPKLQLTATAVAMGTVNYMAPEQRRDAKHVDGRADIYSVGVMLYELLTGELPMGRFKPPSERVVGLDVRLDEVVLKALESDPAGRYQNASEVIDALESILGSGITAPGSGIRTSPGLPPGLGGRSGGAWKVGLAVVGGLALLAGAVRLWPTDSRAPVEPATLPAPLPPNTDGELFAAARFEGGPAEPSQLQITFGPGEEEFNAHAGNWTLRDGELRAIQAGNEPCSDSPRLIPRAYVAHRYFSTDDVTLETDMEVHPLPENLPPGDPGQRFAELALRIKDLQVSIFAIPNGGMRLLWRYFTPDGTEVLGNSVRDLEALVEDETPVPPGRFRVRLSLRKRPKGAVEVEAFVNNRRFAHKNLPGLAGQTGKVALGCRSARCVFDGLAATGLAMPRPAPRRAD